MMLRTLILMVGGLISSVHGSQPIQGLRQKVKLPTDVMVLGTMHLAVIQEPLSEDSLSSLIVKLKGFQPTAIAIEALRPADIIAMAHGVDEYRQTLEQFVGETALSLAKEEQKALGVTPAQAISQRNRLLTSNSFSLEQREKLIRLAVAAYDINTAILHWQYHPKPYSDAKLSLPLQEYLKKRASRNNEINQIAVVLAIQCGLNRLYPIDDQLDKDLYPEVIGRLMESFSKSKYTKLLRESEYVTKPQALMAQAVKSGDWLPLYTWLNSEEYKAQVVNQEWRTFLDKDLAVKPSLERIALWEIRNLNMASHIMRVVAQNIGGKIIVIVGSNHRVFFEDYLSRMIGVNLVSFDTILAENKNNVQTP